MTFSYTFRAGRDVVAQAVCSSLPGGQSFVGWFGQVLGIDGD